MDHSAKTGLTGEIDHDNSMAKIQFLHQISCRVNQQAQLSIESKRAMNYVPVGRNCQKV